MEETRERDSFPFISNHFHCPVGWPAMRTCLPRSVSVGRPVRRAVSEFCNGWKSKPVSEICTEVLRRFLLLANSSSSWPMPNSWFLPPPVVCDESRRLGMLQKRFMCSFIASIAEIPLQSKNERNGTEQTNDECQRPLNETSSSYRHIRRRSFVGGHFLGVIRVLRLNLFLIDLGRATIAMSKSIGEVAAS